MKVTREKTEGSQVYLKVEMEPDELEGYMEKSYRRLVERAKVPGFRKGKAPRPILERYLGREGLLEEALNILIPETYEKAIKQENIEPVGQPQIDLEQAEPVIYKAVVPLRPTLKLGDYHQIRATPETVTVTEEQVNNVLEHFRHRSATWESVERPVASGDLVTIDIHSEVEGKPFINQDGVQYHVDLTSKFPAPGFADQVVGMERDQEKEFKIKMPDDFPQKEFAGKEISFKVKAKEIKQEKLPELNDEFAKEVSPECSSLADLKERIKAEIQQTAEQKSHADFEEKVGQALVDTAEIEYPPVLVEREMDRMLDRQIQYMNMGAKELQDYLKSINKTGEQLREDMRPVANKRVVRSLALEKLAEDEKIEVSETEIDEEARQWAESGGEKKDELLESFSSPKARDYIKQVLTTRKAMERLEEIAKGPQPEKPAAETAAKNEVTQEEVKNE